jgi:hypothetical protein
MLFLDRFDHAGAPKDLCVKTLNGEKKNGEIRRPRWIDVLFGDVLSERANAGFELI